MRDYKQYKLKRNKASYRPGRILYLDTETRHRTVYYDEQAFNRQVSDLFEQNPVVHIRRRLLGPGLNLDTLKQDYSRAEIEDLKRSSPGIVRRGGLEPDIIAQEYGYTYDDFINLLKDTPPNKELKEKCRREMDGAEEYSWGYDRREEHHRMDLAWSCFVRRREDGAQIVRWRYHNDTLEICRYIDSLVNDKTCLWIFGHNVYFDLQASDFFHYFTKWGWILEFTYDQGLTYILVIRKGKRCFKILSTTNFFPVSLKKLGELIDLPKIWVDLKTSSRDELSTYCRRDVEIVKYAMEYWWGFLDAHDLGNFALTRASQALTAFRHRFMDTDICINGEEDVKEWERQAYFGGRTECFRVGEIRGGPFVTLDVNSMYPYVMREKEYPVRFLSWSDDPRMDVLDRNLERYCVVARVEIDTDEPAYAVMKDQKLIFPTGRFETWVCTEGLKYARKKGHIRKIFEIAYYEKDYLFEDYVDFFIGLKNRYGQENNPIMREMVKTLLNSLYGKFGQKKPIMEEETDITYDGYWREDIADLVTGEMITVTKLFNKRYATRGHTAARKSFPAIAAHVTEYARFHLWRMIRSIGEDKVLYCDTDSVKVKKKELATLKIQLDDYALGALKNEGETEKLIIHGPKDYETEKGWKAKGVPQKAEKVGDGEYKYQEFMRQSTHLRQGVDRYYIVRDRYKVLERKYSKGVVQPDGRVIPFVLGAG